MLALYQSNRLEQLAGQLAEVLATPAGLPLAPEVVVVPHPGVARWLSLRLAEQLGICANIQFPLPASFIWRAFRALLPDVPDHNAYEPAILHWRILRLLDALAGDSRFAPVQAYLAEGDDLKRYELAHCLAECFDQYLLYRPDWICAWEAGQSALAGDSWQAALWRRLATVQAGPHWVHLRQRLEQVEEHALEDAAGRLPPRLCLFALSTLSPGYLEVLHTLAAHTEIHLFLLNPCRAHWTEIVAEAEKARREIEADGSELYLEVGNPLLASLGRQGRDFFASVMDYDPGSVERFLDPGQDSLLHCLQSDILNLRDGDNGPKRRLPARDNSLQFHSCHSPMREIEVLRDQLLALFEQHPDLEPSDVLVLSPDINSYAPYIEAVFSESADGPVIPYHIADRGRAVEAPLVAAFLGLLRLGHSRFDANTLLALLEVEALRRRFGLAEGDLSQIARWVEESGIRWGWDGGDRAAQGLPETDQNSWRAGLDRLLLGYALPGGGKRLFQGILPYDDVEGSDSVVLGGFCAFAEAVFEQRGRLSRARPIDDWGRELAWLLGSFFEPPAEDESQIQLIRDAIETLQTQAQVAGFDCPVSVDLVRTHLESLLAGGAGGGRFLSGGVSFCALIPMRSLPYEVICMIGMNDGQFPRQRRAPDFDLMARRFRLGDRTRRADDRYLFLETLLAARRCLYFSYVGQDIRDNSPLPPSVLVGEVLDYLDRTFMIDVAGGGVRTAIITHHPLQAFSRRYFTPDTGLFSYSAAMAKASAAASEPSRSDHPFIPEELPEPDTQWRCLDLEGLIRFFSNPARFLLQGRLGVHLEEGEGLLETREPFALDYFTRNDLMQRLVEAEQAGEDGAGLLPLARAAGLLPHGRLGECAFEHARAEAQDFGRGLQGFLEAQVLEPIKIDLTLGEMRLQGWLDGVGPRGLSGYSVHRIWEGQLLGLWLRHLVLNVLQPAGVKPLSRWQDTERRYQLKPVAGARACLTELLAIYWQGLHRPLHFFPKSSREYAQARHQGKDEAAALKKAAAKWAGDFVGRAESADPYYQLALPGGEVLDGEFQRLSVQVFGPLYAHLED